MCRPYIQKFKLDHRLKCEIGLKRQMIERILYVIIIKIYIIVKNENDWSKSNGSYLMLEINL